MGRSGPLGSRLLVRSCTTVAIEWFAMSDLGSGMSLDDQWDLYVDESNGDLAFSTAEEEVKKDLAFQIARVLGDVVGDYIGQAKQADIRIAVRKLVINDSRIEEIQGLNIRTPTPQNDIIEIDMVLATTEGTTIDDTFTVGS